jgi:hypothetical protein
LKIHDVKQGTPEWLTLRASYPTASEFSNLVTPAQLKPSKSMGKYVAQKLAEKWLGHPLQSFGSGPMDQGKVREEEARPWYAAWNEVEVETPGFITNDADTAGCSPDGIITGASRGLEIKCPEPDTHVLWLTDGIMPSDHRLQVQGSMWVCGLEEWDFVSYHPRFPAFTSRIRLDTDVGKALEEAIGRYWEEFKLGWGTLLDANGGEGPQPPAFTTEYEEDGTVVRKVADWDNPVFSKDQLKWFNEKVEKVQA